MACDLEEFFGPLEAQLPVSEDEDTFVLSALNLPIPPAEICTGSIIIEKGYQDYLDYYRADLLTVQALPSAYAQLALLILSVVFHEIPLSVELHLTHPSSHVTRMSFTYDGKIPYSARTGYIRRPEAFGYSVTELARYERHHVDPYDLPCFYLCSENETDILVTPQDWEGRRVVKGFGRDTGCVQLAELLLNLSRTNPPHNECELEGFAGIGGVGPMSAEVRFWLPGHCYWTADFPPTEASV